MCGKECGVKKTMICMAIFHFLRSRQICEREIEKKANASANKPPKISRTRSFLSCQTGRFSATGGEDRSSREATDGHLRSGSEPNARFCSPLCEGRTAGDRSPETRCLRRGWSLWITGRWPSLNNPDSRGEPLCGSRLALLPAWTVESWTPHPRVVCRRARRCSKGHGVVITADGPNPGGLFQWGQMDGRRDSPVRRSLSLRIRPGGSFTPSSITSYLLPVALATG